MEFIIISQLDSEYELVCDRLDIGVREVRVDIKESLQAKSWGRFSVWR